MTCLVHTVSQLPQLVYSGTSLDIGIVACTDGTHASGLVPCIALCAVLKVRIRPTRTVYTYVACCRYVWTSVWL